MSKQRKTFSLDPEVAAYLDQEGINASGTVNKLVKQHMGGDSGDDAIRQLRIQQLRSELSELESREQAKERELERLLEIEETEQSQYRERLEEAYESLVDVPWSADNQAVQNWAMELDLDADELIDELERIHTQRNQRNGGDSE